MKGSTLIWGAILAGGVVLMSVLGLFYAYVTKYDKERVMIMTRYRKACGRNYKPGITIRERFSLTLPIVLAGVIAVAEAILLMFSGVFRETLERNEWLDLKILLVIVVIVGHVFIWVALSFTSMSFALCKVSYLEKKYRPFTELIDNKTYFKQW